jgi:uncharacterized damage-inducible protein DinB
MESTISIGKLFEYDDWANRATWQSLVSNQLTTGRAAELFSHVIETEYLWYARIEGRYEHIKSVWTGSGIQDAVHKLDDLRDRWSALIRQLTPAEWARKLTYRNTKGIDYENTIQDILTHVVFHSTYHRGQVVLEIRRAGGEPPLIDYIARLR